MTSLKISSLGEARNIKFGQQVNLTQRGLLGTLPQEVVTALHHNHMTLKNLWLQGLPLSNLGSKNNSLIEAHMHFPLGLVTSLAFDHVTLINLHIPSYSEVRLEQVTYESKIQ